VNSPLRFALLLAIPIEAVNWWLVNSVSILEGFSSDTSAFVRGITWEALAVHSPALVLLNTLGMAGVGVNELFWNVLLLLDGYITTLLLILAVVHVCRLIRIRNRNRNSTETLRAE
jgi:hypothetical protein